LTQELEYALGAMICYELAVFIYRRAAGAGGAVSQC
jgi:hypothetical protein